MSLLLSVSAAAQTLEAIGNYGAATLETRTGSNGADTMIDGAGVPEDRDSTMTSSGIWQFVGPTQGGSDDENESEPDETMGLLPSTLNPKLGGSAIPLYGAGRKCA